MPIYQWPIHQTSTDESSPCGTVTVSIQQEVVDEFVRLTSAAQEASLVRIDPCTASFPVIQWEVNFQEGVFTFTNNEFTVEFGRDFKPKSDIFHPVDDEMSYEFVLDFDKKFMLESFAFSTPLPNHSRAIEETHVIPDTEEPECDDDEAELPYRICPVCGRRVYAEKGYEFWAAGCDACGLYTRQHAFTEEDALNEFSEVATRLNDWKVGNTVSNL